MKKALRVAGCVLSSDGKVLLLHRSAVETDPSLWGIPAGKVEPGETDVAAVKREVFEETGIELSEDALEHLGTLPIEYETVTVHFPIFHASFEQTPDVVLEPREHIDFRWIKPSDALELPDLMKDVDIIINKYCIDKLSMA